LRDIFFLFQVSDLGTTTLWQQGWRSASSLGLNGDLAILRGDYISVLWLGNIRVTDREGEMIWKKAPLGVYTPKLGYISLNINLLQQDPYQWWSGL